MLWSPPHAPRPRQHPAHPTPSPAPHPTPAHPTAPPSPGRGTAGKVLFSLEWFRRQTLKPP